MQPGAVTVLAVSKTHPAQAIRAAHRCGLDHFGESYLQEALTKMAELADLPLTWHFIGPIQSNKDPPHRRAFCLGAQRGPRQNRPATE